MDSGDVLLRALREHERERQDAGPAAFRYELRGELGRGALGTVFRAWDRQLDREVAFKQLHGHLEGSAEVRRRFLREGKALARLAHPHVVAVHDAGEEEGRLYLVMELVEGEPLSRLLASRRCELRQLVGLLAKVACGVHHAHDQGIVHRDLKPANVLVSAAGEPKVGDFGLAHWAEPEASRTAAGILVGTPVYMAPEQAAGGEITPRTDVYALGAMLYEIATGRPPHQGATVGELCVRIRDEEPAFARTLRPDLPVEVAAIAHRALAKEPAGRYGSALVFAEELRRFLAGEPVEARPPGPWERWGRRLRRHRTAAAAGIAGLMLALAVAAAVVPAWWAEAERRAEAERELAQVQAAELARARARERARPFLDAGRRYLTEWDRYLTAEHATPAGCQALESAARAALARALAAHPDLPEARLELARVEFAAGRLDAAEAECDRAIAAGPGFATAHLERAILRALRYETARHGSLGDVRAETPELARERTGIEADLAEVARWSQDAAERTLAEAMLRFADGAFAEAAGRLEEYLRAVPADPRAWWFLGHSRLHVGGAETGAVEALTRVIAFRPGDFSSFNLRGVARLRMGDAARAKADFDSSIRLQPTAEAFENRGLAHNRLGEFAAAAVDFGAALQLAPGSAPLRFQRGVAFSEAGDDVSARAEYDEAIRLDPGHGDAHYNRGLLRYAGGEWAAAEDDFTAAIAAGPPSAEAHVNRGLARSRLRDWAGAIADYTEAIRLEPGLAVAHGNRGMARLDTGDAEGARSDLTEAIRLDPANAKVRVARARAQARLGNAAEAAADARAALECGVSPELRAEMEELARGRQFSVEDRRSAR